jgi:protein MpaA
LNPDKGNFIITFDILYLPDTMIVYPDFTFYYTILSKKCQRFFSKAIVFYPVLTVFFALYMAGCQTPPRPDPYAPELITEVVARPFRAGLSVQNRPIDGLVLGNGDDVTFILATIHGDEPAGTPLVHKLSDYLVQNRYLLENRKVVLLPLANPDGFAANTRYNVRGVDLNRNFTAANRVNNTKYGKSALSEPESQIIAHLIDQHMPDRIVTIHQPLACMDYDGPSLPLAVHMARCCDLPVKRIGAQPGSLGSYVGLSLKIPIITLELRGEDSRLSSQELWDKYGAALLASVTYPERFL